MERLLVAVHLHRFELWREFRADLLGIPPQVRYDLVVTLPLDKLSDLGLRERQRAQILSEFPRARVLLMENRGWDAGGFWHAFDYTHNELRRSYDFVLKIHSKGRSDWRRDLVDAVVGRNGEHLTRCLDLMLRNRNVGLVGTRKWIRISRNEPDGAQTRPLLAEGGVHFLAPSFPFLAGTIFVSRWDILRDWAQHVDLKRLCRHRFSLGFDRIPNLAHSFERLFGAIYVHHGLEVLGV